MPIKHSWQLLIHAQQSLSRVHQVVIRLHTHSIAETELIQNTKEQPKLFLFQHTSFLCLNLQILWFLSSTVSVFPSELSPCSWNCSIQLQDFKKVASLIFFNLKNKTKQKPNFLRFLNIADCNLQWLLIVSRTTEFELKSPRRDYRVRAYRGCFPRLWDSLEKPTCRQWKEQKY